MGGNIAIYFPGKLRLTEGRENMLGRLEGARRAAICSHTLMLSLLELLWLQILGLGAPSSCSVSGVQPTLVPACPEPCVLPWTAPGGRAGWWDGLLGCVGCAVPAGLPCGTRQYSLHRFCGCEQAGRASRHATGHGMLRPNLLGEGAGAGLFAFCLWQAQRWLLQTCAAIPQPLNRGVFTGGGRRGWWDL